MPVVLHTHRGGLPDHPAAVHVYVVGVPTNGAVHLAEHVAPPSTAAHADKSTPATAGGGGHLQTGMVPLGRPLLPHVHGWGAPTRPAGHVTEHAGPLATSAEQAAGTTNCGVGGRGVAAQ